MKKTLFTIFLLAVACFSNAQIWDSLGEGTGWAYSMCLYNGNLVVGGFIGGSNGNGVTQWNGTSWSPIGTGMNVGLSGHLVNALTVCNGTLFAGGSFDSAGGQPAYKIAQYNGTNWVPVGAGMNISSENVLSLAVYNGNLYAGGAFDSAGGQPANHIVEWNGFTWSTLGSGIPSPVHGQSYVYSLTVYNGDLYAAGSFDTAGGIPVNNIAKWNGSSWSALGSGILGFGVYALCVYEGNLYAAGNFDTAGGIPTSNIAMWNGANWSSVDMGIEGQCVYALTKYNHELIAGGTFNEAGSYYSQNLAQWDGNSWYPLGNNNTVSIFSLGDYMTALIVGGEFNTIADLNTNDVASWTGGPYSASNICYVTVDTASKYNEILWDKTGVDTNLVDSFRIYSKAITGYKYLGSVSVHNFTQFIDSTSQPNSVSSTYKISSVDTSGLLSLETSSFDQTILLQANIGVGNVVNLSWNSYEGDSVSYYLILRDSLGNGNWQRLDSVPNNINAYTDNHPPISPQVRYIINTIWNLSCVPYASAPLVRTHSLMNTNIITSRSNKKGLAITGTKNMNYIPSLAIYPNPTKDVVTITLSQPENAIITLNDVLGQTIYTSKLTGNENAIQINLSGVRNGVYFLKLSLDNGGELIRKIEVLH